MTKPRRSLILAGGGMKVAFQAGVLQVWLDEAGINFEHADGASGGVFNLAMWTQKMSGRQIADNWRNLDPNLGLDFNWAQYPKLAFASSLFELEEFADNVFPLWGLDWDAIRSSDRDATFNVYNFTDHELEVLSPADMSPQMLVAAVSLPMWFPPVRVDGRTFIDAVFATDANVEEALSRGAEEVWIVWTVSERGEWHDGFVANYFQIIEAAANSHLKQVLARIERSNAALASGRHAEFDRHIEVKALRWEVPLHYLIGFSRDRIGEAVNLGVEVAQGWCEDWDIPYTPRQAVGEAPAHVNVGLSFTEEMKGHIGLRQIDPLEGWRVGKEQATTLRVRLKISVDDVDRFVTSPRHEASVSGYIDCEALGGTLLISEGSFNLFVDEGDPSHKKMHYRLLFNHDSGGRRTLLGTKEVKDEPGFDLWSDTSTLYVRVLPGEVRASQEDASLALAAGVIRIHLLDFMRQLTTFRTTGPTRADRNSALVRFGRLFLGDLWEVYAREVLTSSPL